ncbi:MAG: hypothetical protein ABSH09_07935 [Bryobacteraceae bacterium]|jgi:hypothetical protein
MNFTELESYRVTGVDQACSAGRWPASIRKLELAFVQWLSSVNWD